jgi:hypothetical protein
MSTNYIADYNRQMNSGMLIPGGHDDQNHKKLGNQDQVLKYVYNFSQALLNARAGQPALNLNVPPSTKRIRIHSVSAVADAAIAPLAGGLTVTLNVGGVAKAAVNLTAAVAAGVAIPLSITPDKAAGANGGALTVTVTGGSIVTTVPVGIVVEFSVERV